MFCFEDPKDTRFEKESGVADFGGAKVFEMPEAWFERGVFRPEDWGGGVGRRAGTEV